MRYPPHVALNFAKIAPEQITAGEGGLHIITTLQVPKAGGLPSTKVNVVRWLKQEGAAVMVGDAVVELETEKVNYELESSVEGVLLRIIAREGAQVPVGGAVCHIGKSGDAIPQD